MSVSNSDWINHLSYNSQLPNVEEARNSITISSQIAKTKKIAAAIPSDLLGQVGTTLTHRHWLIEDGEAIIGFVEGGKFISQPTRRTITAFPITWAIIDGEFRAIDGIDKPLKKVVEIARKVEENADKILPHLQLNSNKGYSELSIAVDPRIYLQTNESCFLETNKKGRSIVSPVGKEELESLEDQIIITYISSMDSPQIEEITGEKEFGQQYCITGCVKDEGDGYHETYHIRTG